MNDDAKQAVRVIDFDKCPCCGEEGLATTLYKEEVKKSHVRDVGKYGIYQMGGPIADPEMIDSGRVIIGTKVPYITVTLDVCQNPKCGALFATRIIIGDVAISPNVDLSKMKGLPFSKD